MSRTPRPAGLAAAIRPVLLARIALGAFGVWVASIGVRLLLLSRRPSFLTESAGRWLLGGVLAHDAVIAPTVFLLGALVARFTGARVRQALAAILLIGGSVLIVGLPNALRKGTNANPTVNPLNYNLNLVIVLLAVIGTVTLATLAGPARRRRRARRASVPEPGSAAEPDDTNPPPRPDTHAPPKLIPSPDDGSAIARPTESPQTQISACPPDDQDEQPRNHPGEPADEQTPEPDR